MKIALVRPPSTYADWYRHPHFSLSCLAAVLEANGLNCRIFDAYFHRQSTETLVREVIDYSPAVVGITAMTHEIVEAGRICAELKKHLDIPCIVGGCHVTALPERTLNELPSFDYGIYGEGERPLVDLLGFLSESRPKGIVEKINGLVYRDCGQVIKTDKAPPLTSSELDALPFPAYHHYYKTGTLALAHKGAEYRIMATRGCPFGCSFCMQVLGRNLRRRSPENVLAEIEQAITKFGAHTFRFQDEILVADNRYSRALFQMIITSGLSRRIRWSAQTRANLVTNDIMALAKESGCYLLGMGVESGDDDTLRRIRKAITVDQVKKAVKIIKSHGIELGTYFILGHPHESRATVQKTIDLAVELNTDTIAVGIMVPYPGTEVYRMAKRGEGGYRLISENWDAYDKYGNAALEMDDLPSTELARLQKKAYINFYLKNLRFGDLTKFVWQKRKGFYFLLRKTPGVSTPGPLAYKGAAQ